MQPAAAAFMPTQAVDGQALNARASTPPLLAATPVMLTTLSPPASLPEIVLPNLSSKSPPSSDQQVIFLKSVSIANGGLCVVP